MQVNQAQLDAMGWIDYVQRIVHVLESVPLATSQWHGYLGETGGHPLVRGRYILARWREPNVFISHDDPQTLIDLALQIEAALSGRPTVPDEQAIERAARAVDAAFEEPSNGRTDLEISRDAFLAGLTAALEQPAAPERPRSEAERTAEALDELTVRTALEFAAGVGYSSAAASEALGRLAARSRGRSEAETEG